MSRSDFMFREMIEYIKAPARSSETDSPSIESLVAGIVDDVRNRGDVAVREYSVRFDKAMGAGRYTGGLWVGSYVKVCTHQWLDARGVAAVAPPAARQSASETLEGHRRAAQRRLDRLQVPA